MHAIASPSAAQAAARQDRVLWTVDAVLDLYALPLMDILWRAQEVHRLHFDPNAIQRSTLLSVKTGGWSEDCG